MTVEFHSFESAPGLATSSRKRLKVLHIGKFYPPHMGGMETHLQALCGELRKCADLQVIVSNDGRREIRETVDGVSVLRVPTSLTLFSTSICPRMIGGIRACAADIIHLHLPNPAAVMAYLASGHRGRLVCTYHSDTVRQKLLGPLFGPILHAALRRSSAIIATSPNYLATSPVLQAHRDRCHVIPLGIDLAPFETVDGPTVERLRARYGGRLVIAVGRLVYYKGFEHLIRAMVHVRGRLLIIGDGPLAPDLRALASRLGLGERVMFTGKVPESIVPYYHAADVFALPSVARTEAFGIVQIEAMASGLPVVNTALDSGVPFVSLDGETGLTVPPGDSAALAAALNRLLDDAALRKRFGLAGARRARQEFSLQIMLDRTKNLYEAVLCQAGGNR